MQFLTNKKLSFLLIAGSLLLLLIFQGLWLKTSYEQEKKDMMVIADQVFVDAVRGIEDSILRIAINTPHDFFCDDTTSVVDLQLAMAMDFDTMQRTFKSVKKQFSTLKIREENIDSSFEISIRTNAHSSRSQEFGSLMFFMATVDSSDYYSPFLDDCEDEGQTRSLLENEVQKTIANADLPPEYQLIIISEDKERESGFYSTTQKDIIRGNSYALYFPYYRGFLLKKLLPQILFSILLFSVILLSFFMIWQSLEKQKRLTELKNDFISNVTHELKTPITTVGVAIEALSSFNAMDNPARTQEYLQISKQELDRLTILVDKVLKMSLFEKQAPELKIEALDFRVLMNEVLGAMKLQFEKFAAKVNLQTNGSSFLLQGDRIHLTSVIYNLVDNALKYSPENPEIELILEEEENQIRLSVKDKGIGIPEVYLNKIFDKFFRVPSGDQHDIKGHGLGLSYVAGVIEKHHGKIHVSSKKNGGTQFTISIPKAYE